jgi:hypothetical protein
MEVASVADCPDSNRSPAALSLSLFAAEGVTIMKKSFIRFIRRPASRRPIRNAPRLHLETLETRLVPANVDVLTYHYDGLLSGNNTQETQLTPANVNSTNFGLLVSAPVDGQIYASPLYKSNLAIPGRGTHNVAFVATENDSVYAFDADTGAQLWKRSFINPAAGVTPVPSADTSGNVFPMYGITGTPVIDANTNTMYVVAQTKEIISGVAHYIDRLHAIDITTGNDRATNAVVAIGDSLNNDTTHNTVLSVPGVGAGSQGGMVQFNAYRQLQRPALTLLNGVVYIGFAGYNDQGPYHGWVVGYRANDFALQGFINLSPNARAAGIWQSGGGLATDGTSLFFATGNTFSGPKPGYSPADNNYGESVIRLTPTGNSLPVADYFTPYNWQSLDGGDLDLGSGGTMLLPDAVGSAAHPHLMVETGKTGNVYLVDRDNMGHNRPNDNNQIVQQFGPLGGPGIWGNPSFFLDHPENHSGIIFYHGNGSDLKALRVTNGMITGVESESNVVFNYPGGQPIVSSSGTTNGIVWDLQVDGTSGATIVRAYNAEGNAQHVLTELYDSNQAGLRDKAGGPVKFTTAEETNGYVLVGSDSRFEIYGLFPSHNAAPAAITGLSGMGLPGGSQIQLNWTNPSPNNATGIKIMRSTDGTNFTQVALIGRNSTTFTDSGLTAATQYYYRVVATNQVGDAMPSNTAAVATRLAAPQLAVVNLTHAEVDLAWQQTGNAGYRVERSFNGGAFVTIANNLPSAQTTYNDTDPTLQTNRGTYAYRVTAFNNNPMDSAVSSVVSITNAPVVIDHTAGFDSHADLTANGNAQFASPYLRLTTNQNQVGTAFSNQRVNIDRFTTSFTFRIHEVSNPPGDGFTFIIQNNTPTTIGGGGGALGYGGIGNSVAIKIDLYDNEGEGDNSTGIFSAGRTPTIRDRTLPPNPTPNMPDISVAIPDTLMNLKNANVKQVDLSYDGTTLHEKITDTVTGAVFTQDYAVNIPFLVNGDAAFVGFGGGTGGAFAVQDIQTWTFNPGPGIPGAPVSAVASVSGANINVNWVSHSTNEDGFQVERSDNDPNHFRVIGTAVAPRFTDTNAPPGNHYYRVRAFNMQGSSPYSNNANIVVGPTSPFTDHANGFANNSDLMLNAGASVAGTRLRLTDGGGGEARTAWTKTKVGIQNFSTSFILQDQNVQGSADGVTFSVQNNDPNQVGGAGGCMGYCGIGKSVAVMFDLYSNATHNSTTNLLTNGNKVGAIDMGPSGIVLGSNHPLRVDLAYDVTQLAFSETVTDMVTGAVFQHVYTNVNVPQIVGGTTAYVGFTGGTGGETAIQDIVSWSGRFLDPVQPVSHVGVRAADSVAGTQIAVTVTALDAFNNAKSGYTGKVHFTSSDPQATLPMDYTFTPGDNGAHTFMGVVLRTAGTQTINVMDTTMTYIAGGTSTTVTPAAASKLLVSYPSPTTAGTLQLFTITAQDAYGNTAPTYRGTVHLSSSDPLAQLSPDATFTAGDNGTHQFAAVLATAGTQTITATDTQTGTIVGTQMIRVNPATAASLVVSGFPSPTTAGMAQSVTITAKDRFGNTATGYTGTVHVTSSDLQAGLPADYTFVAGDNGVHMLMVTLKTAGTQTITATDRSTASITGTQTGIVVNGAAASALQVTDFPSPTTAGVTGAILVTALDAYGNVATGYTGTVHLTSSDGQAILQADYTFTAADNGRHALSGTLFTAGVQSITATDTATSSITGTQSGIVVNAAPAASLVATDFPSPATAGVSAPVTVTLLDAYGNVATGYTGTVSFYSSDLQAQLPGDYTFTAADAGVHTFTVALLTAGTQTLGVYDASNTNLVSEQDGIEVDPDAAHTVLAVAGFPSPITAGTQGMFTVTAEDPYGNLIADYAGTVAFFSSDDQAQLPDNYTFTPDDQGSHTFMATLNTPGIQSIGAIDIFNRDVMAGEQDNIEVDPAGAPAAGGRSRSEVGLSLAGVLSTAGRAHDVGILSRPLTAATSTLHVWNGSEDLGRGVTDTYRTIAKPGAVDAVLADWDGSLVHGVAVDDLVEIGAF